jgi:pimeloyl-ACP methyl ester carboxylesterase
MKRLLFLHGALGSAAQFEPLVNAMSEFQPDVMEFPLHGSNETHGWFTIESFAEYLISYIEQQGYEKVYVFGYSMGGYAALYAALQRPELFEGIMTLATKFNWNEQIALKEINMLNPDELEKKVPHYVEQLKSAHRHIEWKDMLNRTISLIDGLGRNPLLSPEVLHQSPVKIRVGVGDKDMMVTLEETIEIYRHLRNGSMYVLPDVKHPLEKVNLGLLKVELMDFCSKE